ncbi:hypothetical protein HMPREF9447_03566 [Bacteroides oleiciplenus YIT 12058]|uniref:Uncharacterized protein n=1 Tax=Bacteroides oleiciplenus YIT 12058 TaxID=742727 RepID=K9E0T7_9BACE|nr:hypothetical protein HMPREF9447_03566 [Bacteroides oleiciplenus YIT 12058]
MYTGSFFFCNWVNDDSIFEVDCDIGILIVILGVI